MKKKIIPIIMTIIGILLIASGISLKIIQNNKKNQLLNSITTLKSEMFEKLTIQKEKQAKKSVIGTAKLTITNSRQTTKQHQPDESFNINQLLQNISNININYTYNCNLIDKKLSLRIIPTLKSEQLTDIVLYNDENDTGYIYLKNIYDKYINIGKTDLFSIINNQQEKKHNYLLQKIKDSIINNIQDNEVVKNNTMLILDEKEEKVEKISIKFDNSRLNQLLKNILDDLNEDQQTKRTLKEKSLNISESKIKEIIQDIDNIEYAIYKGKDKILKYELSITKNNNKKSLVYINKKLPELVILSNNKQDLKIKIDSTDKVLNMTMLNSKNQNIGTYSQDEKSINLDTTYKNTNYKIIGSKENNIFNINMTTKSINENYILFNLMLNGTISENTDFQTIDVSNNKEINQITEEETKIINNNLMTIITKILR
ncbi:MAG: hypothetical protein J6B89_03815 [Bacilli bacterium]|nr:hypothetical protein [Bacilli bacterium]